MLLLLLSLFFLGFPTVLTNMHNLPVPGALITDGKALCFVLIYVTELILKMFISQLRLGDSIPIRPFQSFKFRGSVGLSLQRLVELKIRV